MSILWTLTHNGAARKIILDADFSQSLLLIAHSQGMPHATRVFAASFVLVGYHKLGSCGWWP